MVCSICVPRVVPVVTVECAVLFRYGPAYFIGDLVGLKLMDPNATGARKRR